MQTRFATIAAAAILVRRDKSRIYAWVRAGQISSWEAVDGTLAYDTTGDIVPVPRGTLLVDGREVTEHEHVMTLRKNNTTRQAA